jgi:diacylglycerol kinase (ATP)
LRDRLRPPEAPAESPFKGKTGLIRVVHAFFNSLAGLRDAWRHESAFRQEVLLALVLIPVASSVEAAIDRISFDHHSLSKRAKDIGSAAVFVSLLLLALVWGLILPPRLL